MNACNCDFDPSFTGGRCDTCGRPARRCEVRRCRRTDTTLYVVYGPGRRERVMDLCPTHEAAYGGAGDQ